MRYILPILIILLATVPLCSAAIDLNPVSVGAEMIADGIDLAITMIADSLMGVSAADTIATNNTTMVSQDDTITGMIKEFSAWSVSPFEYSTVIEALGLSLCLAVFFMFMYAICGAAYVAMSRMSSRKLALFHHLMNANSGHSAFSNYGQNIIVGGIAMTFMAWGVFMTLLLSKVLKMMIMDGITDAISPSMTTVSVLYLSMAIMWVLVSVFFGISNIIICLTAALSFLLGALYASDRTRHITVKWMDYFFGMVLMQVFVVFIVALSVSVIMDVKSTPEGGLLFATFPMAEASMYMGLILFVLIGCTYFILGKGRIIKTGKTVIKMVV